MSLFQIRRISLQTCGNEFNLHENEPFAGTYFHMNSFAGRLILTQNHKITQKYALPSLTLCPTGSCVWYVLLNLLILVELKSSHYKKLSYDLALYGFLLLISYLFRKGEGGGGLRFGGLGLILVFNKGKASSEWPPQTMYAYGRFP